MSFIFEDDSKDPVVPAKYVTPKVAEPTYRNNVIDTDYLSQNQILPTLSGFKMSNVYYRGVHGTDDEARGQDISLNPVWQQFEKVVDMVIFVNSPLSSSQDQKTKRMEVTGSGHVMSFGWFIPNYGDNFIAQSTDGREAVFEVVSTERKGHFNAGVYEIRYRLKDFLTNEIQYDLDRKTGKTYYYREDFLNHGQSPLIEDKDIAWVRNIQERFPHMVDTYFSSFYSNEKRTLIIPGQTGYYYDHFLNMAMIDFYMTSSEAMYGMHRTMNVSDDEMMRATTVFDLIFKRDKALYQRVVHRMGTVSPRSFTKRPEFMGIYHLRFTKVIYPLDKQIKIDYQIRHTSKAVEALDLVNTSFRPMDLAERFAPTNHSKTVYGNAPLIHPILADDYYIFTKAFYERDLAAMSAMERLLTDYMDKKPSQPSILQDLIENHESWDLLEQFYYTPFLLLLMQANLRGL